MTYQSISNILQASEETISQYLADLIAENPNGEISLRNAMIALRNTPESELPLTDPAYLAFQAHIYNIYDENLEVEELPLVTEEVIRPIRWIENGVPHCVFLNADQYEHWDDLITALDEGDDYALDELRRDTPTSFEEGTKRYLISLGILEDNILPENSATLLVKEDSARFSGAIWYEAIQQKIIVLAGVGGIGSYVGFLLARMHPKSMFIYDDDRVEAVNMSGQLYGKNDVTKYKVDALSAMVSIYANYQSVFAINQRFTEESEPARIMICGFDNMAARKLFYKKWKNLVYLLPEDQRGTCLFIDGRLAAEDLQVYCLTGDNGYGMTKYETTCLFTDEEADETVCSYKQTTYMANMIGSIIVNLFTNFVANELVGAPIRDLPYLTSYAGSTMQFKTE